MQAMCTASRSSMCWGDAEMRARRREHENMLTYLLVLLS